MAKPNRLIIERDGKQQLNLDVIIPELQKKLAGSNPPQEAGA